MDSFQLQILFFDQLALAIAASSALIARYKLHIGEIIEDSTATITLGRADVIGAMTAEFQLKVSC